MAPPDHPVILGTFAPGKREESTGTLPGSWFRGRLPPRTRVTPGRVPGTPGTPLPGDTCHTRKCPGLSWDSPTRGHVSHPKGSRDSPTHGHVSHSKTLGGLPGHSHSGRTRRHSEGSRDTRTRVALPAP